MSDVMEITDTNFETEVLKSNLPFLVDFGAAWCGPCKQLEPIVHQVASEYAGKIKVGKVDIDKDQEVASSFGIMSVPTLLLFKNGKVVNQTLGFVPKEKIVASIKAAL